MVEVGEHVRGPKAVVDRVVGTDPPIALLRLTDGEGRRRATCELRHVDLSTLEDAFAAVSDPDSGRSLVRAVRNAATGV